MCSRHLGRHLRAVLVNIWAVSCVQAVKRDLLVAYSVIDIRDISNAQNLRFSLKFLHCEGQKAF